MPYPHRAIEPRWQKSWEDQGLFHAADSSGKPKAYLLVEFPFLSGDGLHVGHIRSYAALDALARKRRMDGQNVLFPMGWDAFGLPTENFAIKTGIHPRVVTDRNIATFRRQMQSLGLSFDWSREVDTSDPAYYRWTQWIFLQLFKRGLAYQATMPINWCPKDLIGLANEEVVGGKCERCGTTVTRKMQTQWMLKITAYADRLLRDLDTVEYMEKIKTQQINWIGRSEGAEIDFQIRNPKSEIQGKSEIRNQKSEIRNDPRRVLIGTRNPAKVEMIRGALASIPGLEIVTLDDIGDVDDRDLEEGNDFKENAQRKAEFYFRATGIPTIATDHILWLEKWPKDDGFIVHIRKLAKSSVARATDDDVAGWIRAFVKEHGESKARFHYAVGYADAAGARVFESVQNENVLIGKSSRRKREGYVTDRFLKDPRDGAYRIEQPDEIAFEKFFGFVRGTFADQVFADAQDRPVAVIVHGSPSRAPYPKQQDRHWIPWLANELEKLGYDIIRPEMPDAHTPNYAAWKKTFDTALAGRTIDDTTVVVGHSAGCSFLARYLGDTKRRVGRFVAVAPSYAIVPKEKEQFERLVAFYDFPLPQEIARHMLVLWSTNDTASEIESARQFVHFYRAEQRSFHDRGHFTQSDGVTDLPEALWWIRQDTHVRVFTTRPDTIFGATYLVVAPEHQIIQNAKFKMKNYDEVQRYVAQAARKSDLDRTDLAKEKTGVELKGISAINPANGEGIPIWVADYVLSTYGTGAIMAVPGHDERDYKFAQNYKLRITQVIAPFVRVTDGNAAFRPGQPIVRRKTVYAVVKHWKNDQYLGLNWKEYGWHSFVIGGVAEGEDLVTAAAREIQEETGYQNMRFVRHLGRTDSEYFAAHKGENRYAEAYGLLFELVDGKKIPTPSDEKARHEMTWVKRDAVGSFLTIPNHRLLWEQLLHDTHCYTGDGVLMHSGRYDGMLSIDAKKKIVADLEKRGEGESTVQYKLRDWVFSRQHYWGEPIPIIHCPEHGPVPVPEDQLPLELPYVEKYQPTGTGESPLASIADWVNTTCPTCGKPAKRETDTMPNWAGSSWYFLRYCDPHNDTVFAYRDALDHWLPVDIYNGGMEHTTLHLLYSRFWYKFLFDEGLVPTTEPYRHRHSHGIVLAADSRKMSKSFGNVVNPDALVEKYGADALRLYELFMGPFEDAIPWSPQGIVGTRRFLDRVWALGQVLRKENTGPATADVLRPLHQTIRKIGEDLEAFKFNTAVSSLMSCLNVFTDHPEQVDRAAFATYLTVLAPFAPHLAEELWRMFGHEESIFRTPWPSYDSRIAADEEIEIAVQINGKVRGRIRVPAILPEEKVHSRAIALPNVARYLAGQTIRKRIYVPGRLVNFVV